MADQHSSEGSSSGNVSSIDAGSDSNVQLNIKTLDSQIYSFRVDKNMPVSLFKEKIANEIGVPVVQQRLIFRGKVLKNDHLLSEYHVEDGHTLHLVARQPAQSQDSSGTSAGETNGNNSNRENDPSAVIPRGRVGQVSHSVVLGTFNVGDQGEGGVPDLGRVIGAVLNSIGIGGQPMANVTGPSSNPGASPQGNGAGVPGNVDTQSQAGNQAQSGQAFPSQLFQSLPQALQIPIATTAAPIPSLNTPIPGSLTTLSEFMNRMGQAFSQNGYQPNPSTSSTGDRPRVDLPSSAQGLHMPEALSIVLRQAEQLLSSHAVAALSHIAGRLEQDRESSDPTVRGQIQAESVRIGLAMQHLGALFLELGRTLLTLRMGQTPAESIVNAGPAVYISPSGPNPIMVQPFPLQTNSLFSGSIPSVNPMTLGSAGIGNGPRNINIHIHAGTSLAPIVTAVGTRSSNGDGLQGERPTGNGSTDSGVSRAIPVRNVIAAAVPSRPSAVSASHAAQPGSAGSASGVSASQSPSDFVSLSSRLAGLSSHVRSFVNGMQGNNTVQSGQAVYNVQNSSVPSVTRDGESEHPSTMVINGDGESSVSLPVCVPEGGREDTGVVSGSKEDLTCLDEGSKSSASRQITEKCQDEAHKDDVPISSGTCGANEGAKAVPLGLGFGGLERKRRARQQKPSSQTGDSGTTSTCSNDNQQARSNQQARDGEPLGRQGGSVSQVDMASVMSQVLHSPALNGLLSGVSEQTGVGSPDALRNMLQQFTQSPQMRNVVNQIAQQVDGQDVGNMFTGMGAQGGGMDFSRMFQQMMPIVSQALGATGANPQEPLHGQRSTDGYQNNNPNLQDGLQSVAQRMENMSSPEDVFRALVEYSFRLSGGESGPEGLVDELCSDEDLANEYIELLQSEVRRRIQGDS